MKRLILMRHAKSSWNDGVADFDRPLNQRGRREAPQIAHSISARSWIPDKVLHSNARRTTETWELMAAVWQVDLPAESREELYLPSVEQIERTITQLPVESQTALLIGHNPGWEIAVSQLAHRVVQLKTAHAALLECAVDCWTEFPESSSRVHLIDIIVPANSD